MENLVVWIFGFGSLMTDGWESNFLCAARSRAVLPGYQRTFNKKSVKRWGTKAAPGVTLNLEQNATSSCQGICFQFSDDKEREVLAYLHDREACGPTDVDVLLNGDSKIAAKTYIYDGPLLIACETPVAQRVKLNALSRGTGGTGREYVKSVYEALQTAGVEDAAVTEFWEAMVAAA